MTEIEKYGFSLVRRRSMSEIDAEMYEFKHDKTGARVIYLDREDENKTFAIGFATPPEDDTGVFHIIEHSVLCGSEKYPLNDPFAELLKGSLNTFLNAITYEDRTIYPVSSRCEKDFLNLTDVYLDAVFSPNMLKNSAIFRQEGWHYEYDEASGRLIYNGVVFNEMKGAFSSPDELGAEALNRALFSGTPYCFESGGKPTAIPNLTYDQFKATHKKYYHPSRAKIVLDGKIDLDKLLPLISSHLDQFEIGDELSLAGKSEPRIASPVRIGYEIPENEDGHGKARVLYGYVYSDWSDSEANLICSILSDILCGSNASPLKKVLLEKNLAKDAAMYSVRSREQTLVIEIRDADEERLDEIDELVSEVIGKLVRDGIDKNKITSTLNSIEFRLRERDFGTLPTGIVFAMNLYGIWMYSDHPEEALLLDDVVRSVREKIETDCFEKALDSIILNGKHTAKVIMLPDKELGQRNEAAEAEKLQTVLSSMSDAEIKKVLDEEKELRLWQQTEPTEEELNCLPKLELSDIPKKSDRPFGTIKERNGVKIINCPIKTNGIVYISLLFDTSDLSGEELLLVSMLSSALLNFPTESYSPLELQNEVKANLGSLFASIATGSRNGVITTYLKIGASALLSKTDDMVRLIRELALTSRIDDTAEIKNLATQIKTHLEDMMISSGETLALSRAQASLNEEGAVTEYMGGYEAYKLLCDICDNDERIAALTADISALLKKLTDRRRLTISVTGDASDELLSEIISIFPSGEGDIVKKRTALCADKKEFVLTPSKVAYAVVSGMSDRVKDNLGLMRVVRSILSYEYLWNNIRVLGGAYGCGFVAKRDGALSFYSYRDPNPAASLKVYTASVDYLRELAGSGEDITKFIIGSIGEHDMLITPRTASLVSTTDYLNGWSAEDEARVRREMLGIKAEDLCRAAEIIDSAISRGSTAVVGGQEHLATLDRDGMTVIKI